jgi:hypothetical protein
MGLGRTEKPRLDHYKMSAISIVVDAESQPRFCTCASHESFALYWIEDYCGRKTFPVPSKFENSLIRSPRHKDIRATLNRLDLDRFPCTEGVPLPVQDYSIQLQYL